MNKKTKVLFLLEAFDKGGIEKVTLDIVNGLDPEKYDITVQTFWFGGHCQSQVKDHVKVIPFFFRRYVRGIIRLIAYLSPRMLYRLFVHGDYDVEIACSDGGAAKVISGSTNPRSRKVCWVHMDVVERGSKLKEFRNEETGRPIYEKFDTIACVSRNGLNQFRKKFGEYTDMRAVHNPLPDQEIREKAELKQVKRDQRTTFVSVGRLEVEKGFERLIEAAGRLKAEGEMFQIRIIGDGGKREMLAEQIRREGLEDTVYLTGFSDNPYPEIAGADWYICSSLDEAYSLTVGEALVLGTPVLGTDCTGVREWLEDSRYGILLENSVEGIYKGMKQALCMSSEEYNCWKQAGAKKAQQISFRAQIGLWEREMIGS